MLARSLKLLAALTPLAGCMAQATSDDVQFTDRAHQMPFRDSDSHDGASAPPAPVAPAGAHLDYHGGKVIQNVNITKVLYGSGTFIPELTSTTVVNIVSSYTQMVSSGVFDWLSEYNTTSPAQTIGRGTVGPSVSIPPA